MGLSFTVGPARAFPGRKCSAASKELLRGVFGLPLHDNSRTVRTRLSESAARPRQSVGESCDPCLSGRTEILWCRNWRLYPLDRLLDHRRPGGLLTRSAQCSAKALRAGPRV